MEIRNLYEKMDNFLQSQWQHLLDFQQAQTDVVQELIRRTSDHIRK